jgi:hypothetical protein
MKTILLSTSIAFFSTVASAQNTQVKTNHPIVEKAIIAGKTANYKNILAVPVATEIAHALNKLLSDYACMPNNETTWAQIRQAANNRLMQYFLDGKLKGTKPAEAFFVKAGNDTMTATDIANHKMILQTGIATIKPADFTIINAEQTCAK